MCSVYQSVRNVLEDYKTAANIHEIPWNSTLHVSQPVSPALALAVSYMLISSVTPLCPFSQNSDCFKIRKKVAENNAHKSVPCIPLPPFRGHRIAAVCHSLSSGYLYCSVSGGNAGLGCATRGKIHQGKWGCCEWLVCISLSLNMG